MQYTIPYKIFLLLFFSTSFVVIGCSSTTSNLAEEDNLPYVDPSQIGNVRLALLSKDRESNIVLINQSNTRYLKPQDFVEETDREKVPITALKYQATELHYDNKTVVVIVEDEVMAKLLALFQQYGFDNFAETCSRSQFADSTWPARDTIFAERGSQWQILTRDSKLMNEAQQTTPKSQTYRILKSYIWQAHLTGFRPMQVLYNVQGTQIFQNSQNQLQQDIKNIEKHK